MSNRDDFTLKTKQILAERVAFSCSFPGCPTITIGPSKESIESTSNIGMACHIAAAAGGKSARRFIKEMTPEERSSINNGIWMCYKHGKLIDTDESRFTIDILQSWKNIAEKRAQIILDGTSGISRDSFTEFLLAENEISISELGNENIIIGQALKDSCVSLLWGERLENAVRDLSIEVCLNSIIHGNANFFNVNIKKGGIELIDDGEEYDPLGLNDSKNKSGGTITVQHLLKYFEKELIVVSKRQGRLNKIVISFVKCVEDVVRINPCSYEFSRETYRHSYPRFESNFLPGCKNIFFVLPEYYCPSDINILCERLEELVNSERSLVFVGNNLSEISEWLLMQHFPKCRILNFQN